LKPKKLIKKIQGGTAQIFIREQGFSQPIPAPRLSDGTLHYLFLMALLLDPNPYPLLCIEEPELGLHPDILISALSPESVVICERDEEGSHLRRLDY